MKQPVRVLHICALNAGGIESFVMNLYRKINKDKIIFDFFNYFDKDIEQFHEKEVKSYGSKVYKTGSMDNKNTIIRNYKKMITLYKFLKKNKYQIIHIHASNGVSIIDALVAKFAKVPTIIVHSHNTSMDRGKKTFLVKKLFHNIVKYLWGYAATNYFACSNSAAKWMYSKKMIKCNKIVIINNAIDIKKYIFNKNIREKVRKSLKIDNEFVIGHIGRFSYQKNHDFLIDIFLKLKNQYNNSILLLIGCGELEDEIKSKVKKLNLEKNVIFYGVTDKVSQIMQAMDIFVLPSRFEGLPLVGIEAQASGLKVVASNTISDEMKITKNVKFLSLNNNVKVWSDEILKYKNGYKRKNLYDDITMHGYNINNISKFIEDFYLSKF